MTQVGGMKATFSRQKAGYLPTLDGWRTVAIFGVMLFHSGPIFPSYPRIYNFQIMGANGVELFFAISGILICTRLLDEEAAWGKISLRGFYIRRIFRIQPAAFVFLFVVALLSILGTIPFSKIGWTTSLLSVRNFYQSKVPADGAVYTAHFWSLALEEHFYLILPWVLILLRKRHRIRWFTVLTVLSILSYELMTRPSSPKNAAVSEFELCWLFFPAWLALLLRNPSIRRRFTTLLPAVPTLVAVCVICFGVVFHWRYIQHLWLPSFSLLVISTMLHPSSLPGRFLELSWMRIIGRISYSLYLWQQLFCISLLNFPPAHGPLGWMQQRPLSYILPIACAFLSYYFIEKPLIRIGHRLAPPLTAGHQDLTVAPA